MSTLFNLIGSLLTEGFSFIKLAYDYITNFLLSFTLLAQLGFGISPLISIPLITFLPLTLTISVIKFILRKGK